MRSRLPRDLNAPFGEPATEGLKTTEAALARTLRAMDAVRADRLPWTFTGCAAATELLRLRINQVKKTSD